LRPDTIANVNFRSFEAPPGERLDIAIAEKLELSRTYAKNLVSDGFVQINGKPVEKASHKLRGAEIVTVMMPPPRPMRVEGEDIPLEVIYEDADLIAINKPPNLITHPTASVRTGTVVNALLGKHKLSRENEYELTSDDYRPGIVHRLDKNTSGVMVIAKNDEAHRHLSASFKKRLTEKEYIAIAVGKLDDDVHLDASIGRHPVHRQKMSVGGEGSRPANTYFRVLARIPGYVLVKAKPHTGRTHQIRVHLAYLGASILGDEVYGKGSSHISRQALHAYRLTLPHPKTNQAISFIAHVPVDMIEAWLKLGGTWPPFGFNEL
jgi:23S rRNA pseudouridine1911/1915/1917 synthase